MDLGLEAGPLGHTHANLAWLAPIFLVPAVLCVIGVRQAHTTLAQELLQQTAVLNAILVPMRPFQGLQCAVSAAQALTTLAWGQADALCAVLDCTLLEMVQLQLEVVMHVLLVAMHLDWGLPIAVYVQLVHIILALVHSH